MALDYKLEFVFDETAPADASVFIQLRSNPPVYQKQIDKEDYDTSGINDPFLNGLFKVAGVVEASTTAYRVWVMKSPSYNWTEVLNPLLTFIATFFGQTELKAMPGSGNVDGTGFTLEKVSQRRKT